MTREHLVTRRRAYSRREHDLREREVDALRDLIDPDESREDTRCVDCGVELEPGAPPICSECVDS